MIKEYTLAVKTNNFLVSNILGELNDSNAERIGFLLGHYDDQKESNLKQDYQRFSPVKNKEKPFDKILKKTEKVNRNIFIESFVFFPRSTRTKSGNGDPGSIASLNSCEINAKNLSSFLKDTLDNEKKLKVVGWFVYRPNTKHTPSISEVSLHQQFSQYFAEHNSDILEAFDLCNNHFLYLLFGSRNIPCSLCTLEYTAFRIRDETKKSAKERKKEKDKAAEKMKFLGLSNDMFLKKLLPVGISIENIENSKEYDSTTCKKGVDESLMIIKLDKCKFVESQQAIVEKLKGLLESEIKELRGIEKQYSEVNSKIEKQEKLLQQKADAKTTEGKK